MATHIQLLRGTTAEWTARNPVLAEGEMGIDLDLNAFKIGDGIHTWFELTFVSEGPAGETGETGDSRFPSAMQSSPVNGDVFADSGQAYIYLTDHWYQFNVVGPYFV